jgi:hypothetical protein
VNIKRKWKAIHGRHRYRIERYAAILFGVIIGLSLFSIIAIYMLFVQWVEGKFA